MNTNNNTPTRPKMIVDFDNASGRTPPNYAVPGIDLRPTIIHISDDNGTVHEMPGGWVQVKPDPDPENASGLRTTCVFDDKSSIDFGSIVYGDTQLTNVNVSDYSCVVDSDLCDCIVEGHGLVIESTMRGVHVRGGARVIYSMLMSTVEHYAISRRGKSLPRNLINVAERAHVENMDVLTNPKAKLCLRQSAFTPNTIAGGMISLPDTLELPHKQTITRKEQWCPDESEPDHNPLTCPECEFGREIRKTIAIDVVDVASPDQIHVDNQDRCRIICRANSGGRYAAIISDYDDREKMITEFVKEHDSIRNDAVDNLTSDLTSALKTIGVGLPRKAVAGLAKFNDAAHRVILMPAIVGGLPDRFISSRTTLEDLAVIPGGCTMAATGIKRGHLPYERVVAETGHDGDAYRMIGNDQPGRGPLAEHFRLDETIRHSWALKLETEELDPHDPVTPGTVVIYIGSDNPTTDPLPRGRAFAVLREFTDQKVINESTGAKESTAFLEIIGADIQMTLPKNHFRAHRGAEPLFSTDHPIWSRPDRA